MDFLFLLKLEHKHFTLLLLLGKFSLVVANHNIKGMSHFLDHVLVVLCKLVDLVGVHFLLKLNFFKQVINFTPFIIDLLLVFFPKLRQLSLMFVDDQLNLVLEASHFPLTGLQTRLQLFSQFLVVANQLLFLSNQSLVCPCQ